MAREQTEHRTDRRPDCVTEIRMGNTVLVVSSFSKKIPPTQQPIR